VHTIDDDLFEAPSAVLRTGIMPRNVSQNIELTWSSDPTPMDPSPGYLIVLHFAELQVLRSNALREVRVTINDKPWFTLDFTFSPVYLYDIPFYNRQPFQYSHYNLSVEATSNSTLPPVLNAAEIFTVVPTTNLGTDPEDGMSCKNRLLISLQKNN
jgi:hypothetical protein